MGTSVKPSKHVAVRRGALAERVAVQMSCTSLAAIRCRDSGLIDAFIANDEIDLIRYRLRAHAGASRRVIIAEANMTIVGQPKRLWVREALSTAELAQYNVRLVFVPLAAPSAEMKQQGLGAQYVRSVTTQGGLSERTLARYDLQERMNAAANFGRAVNDAMRFALNLAVFEELHALSPKHRSQSLVFVSDVDEILDVSNTTRLWRLLAREGCASPRMRYFFYSEFCPTDIPWWRAMFFDGSWLYRLFLQEPFVTLRGHMADQLAGQLLANCSASTDYLGWHLSYFMDSKSLLGKLDAWRGSLFVTNQTTRKARRTGNAIKAAIANQNYSAVDQWVSSCTRIYNREFTPVTMRFAAFDAVLPPSHESMPRHPAAAPSFSLKNLQEERSADENALPHKLNGKSFTSGDFTHSLLTAAREWERRWEHSSVRHPIRLSKLTSRNVLRVLKEEATGFALKRLLRVNEEIRRFNTTHSTQPLPS